MSCFRLSCYEGEVLKTVQLSCYASVGMHQTKCHQHDQLSERIKNRQICINQGLVDLSFLGDPADNQPMQNITQVQSNSIKHTYMVLIEMLMQNLPLKYFPPSAK